MLTTIARSPRDGEPVRDHARRSASPSASAGDRGEAEGDRALAASWATTPASESDRKAFDELFSATYEELRRLAAGVRRDDPRATLNPTALVNEAWLKLAANPRVARTSSLHFQRIAARAMRQVLVEAARRRYARKRGGKDAVFVTFDESLGDGAQWAGDLLGLDAALEGLARFQPRQALMVESRFFGGLDVAETAELLGVSEATVLRDWRAARAWLARELRQPR
jgi:RNA polymerase sigma factor (TIGR02999 family)